MSDELAMAMFDVDYLGWDEEMEDERENWRAVLLVERFWRKMRRRKARSD